MAAKRSMGVLAHGSIDGFFIKLLGTGAAFLMHIFLARTLGKYQYGVYLYAMAWINILAIFSMFGLSNSIVRFVACYHATRQWPLMKGFLQRSFYAVLLSSLILGGAGFFWILLSHQIEGDLKNTLLLAFFVLPVLSLVRLREAGLRAFKRIRQSNLLLLVLRPVFLITTAAILFLGLGVSAISSNVMLVHLFCLVTVYLIGTFWFKQALPFDPQVQVALYDNKEWLTTTLPLLFIDGTYMILNQADVIMIGLIKEPSDSGVYSAASLLAGFSAFGTIAINMIAAPLISELYNTRNTSQLHRIIRAAAYGGFSFCLLSGLFLCLTGKWILNLYGTAFTVGYSAMLVLLLGQLVNSLMGPVEYLMVMTRYQYQAGIIVAISAVINIGLNALLIPRFHLLGASAATAIAMISWNAMMSFYLFRKLHICPVFIRRGNHNPL